MELGLVETTAEGSEAPRRRFLPPSRFLDALKEKVVGQDDLKPHLAFAFSAYTAFLDNPKIERPSPLIYGPSGSGKTYSIKVCCEVAGIPYVEISAPSVSPAGYRGMVLRDVFAEFWRVHQDDHGILFVDEVDKWCRMAMAGDAEQIDLGLSKMAEMLTYVRGTWLTFFDEAKDYDELRGVQFYTGNLMFCFAGAFVGLDKIVQRQTGHLQIPSEEILKWARPKAFIEYGLTPEFCGRISSWGWTKDLTVVEIAKILRIQDAAKWEALFQMLGCKLTFMESAFSYIANQAKLERGNVNVAKELFEKFMSELYVKADEKRLTKLEVTSQTVATGSVEAYAVSA